MKRAKFTGCSHERLSFNSCRNCPDYEKCAFKTYEEKHNKRIHRTKSVAAKLTSFFAFILVASFILSFIATLDSQENIVPDIKVKGEETSNQNKNEVTEETYSQETDGAMLEVESEIQVTTETTAEATTEATTEATEPTVPYEPIKLEEYKISAIVPYDNYIYILSEEDMIYIAKMVWAEARGECYEGKVAVAAVALNRYFSDNPVFNRTSILSILKQDAQFASISNVTMYNLECVPDCMKAVQDACKGWDPTREVFEEGALYFYNPEEVSGWQAEVREGIKVMVIGNHNFHYDFEKVEE